MAVRYAEWRPDSVLARCVSYGSGAGALTGGSIVFLLLFLDAAEYGGAVLAAGEVALIALLISLGIGAVIGMACGLVALAPGSRWARGLCTGQQANGRTAT